MTGIEAVGAYAPQFRVSAEEFADAWGRFKGAGVRTKAVPGADEDALTMAHEAAERALTAADRDAEEVAFLAFASTTPPLAEADLAVRLGETLGVPSGATRHVFTGSTRAGTRALTAGLAAGPWDDAVGLVVAADAPRGEPNSGVEHAAGAGAAAFVLSERGAVEVTDAAEYAADYPGTRFRRTGDDAVESLDITQYERRAFTETLRQAVAGLDADVGDVAVAAVQAPNGKLPYRAAGALGVSTDAIQAGTIVHDLGDTGAASVPLGLANALDDGAKRVLLAAFGSGAAADAMLVEASDDVPTDLALDGEWELSYAEYLRMRGELTSGPPNGGGAYVSVPSWRRTLPQRYRLEAGRCPSCGALNFPPEGACSACSTLGTYESVELSGRGTVEAVTTIEQGGAPPEFAEQQAQSGGFAVAIVAFDGPDGDAVSAPVQVAQPADNLEIGDRVTSTLRQIYTQEDVTRYGLKVRPE